MSRIDLMLQQYFLMSNNDENGFLISICSIYLCYVFCVFKTEAETLYRTEKDSGECNGLSNSLS